MRVSSFGNKAVFLLVMLVVDGVLINSYPLVIVLYR